MDGNEVVFLIYGLPCRPCSPPYYGHITPLGNIEGLRYPGHEANFFISSGIAWTLLIGE